MNAAGAPAPVSDGTISGLELLCRIAGGGIPLPPAAALLGWQLLDFEPGHVRVSYSAREAFYNPHGTVQGGFIAAMLDDAMGPALLTLLDGGEFAPTLEIKVNFLRPALAGVLMAEGRVIHRTRTLAFLEGALMTPDGHLLATASATARIVASMASSVG